MGGALGKRDLPEHEFHTLSAAPVRGMFVLLLLIIYFHFSKTRDLIFRILTSIIEHLRNLVAPMRPLSYFHVYHDAFVKYLRGNQPFFCKFTRIHGCPVAVLEPCF